jgi:glyoxylase-like metal-dependent hydrolase (beta-lactamase superfamily II)
MQRVAEGLYRLEAAGFVNAYLIEGGADLTLVDTGHSRSVDALVSEIKENGFTLPDISRVILTHVHADHVGGLSEILRRQPMKVYAHSSEIPVLAGQKPVPSFRGIKGFFMEFWHEQWLPWLPVDTAQPAQPGTPLRGIPQWQLMHTPGHTAGSLSLFHPVRQILLCGDALSNRGGQLHVPDACVNQSQSACRKTVDMLAKLDVDILCCGHGAEIRGGAFRYIEALLARGR